MNPQNQQKKMPEELRYLLGLLCLLIFGGMTIHGMLRERVKIYGNDEKTVSRELGGSDLIHEAVIQSIYRSTTIDALVEKAQTSDGECFT